MGLTIDKVRITPNKPIAKTALWVDSDLDVIYYYKNGEFIPLCEETRKLWDPLGEFKRSFDDSFNNDFGGDTLADMVANGTIGGGNNTNLIII